MCHRTLLNLLSTSRIPDPIIHPVPSRSDSVYPYLSQPPKKSDPAHQVRNPQQPRMLHAASKVCGVHWIETDSNQTRGQVEREQQDLLG